MNIVKIDGDVPQQMFQYGFYLQLLRHDPEARLHVPHGRWIKTMFRLPRFLEADKAQLRHFGMDGSLKSTLLSLAGKVPGRIVEEDGGHAYDGSVQTLTDTYFDGQWLSPRYFADVASDLREAYTVKARQLPHSMHRVMDMLNHPGTVALHIHQPGDKRNPCTPDYYNWAIASVLASEPKARFYVFTSDLDWAKENLQFQGQQAEFVAYPADKQVQLLPYLHCANHIITAATLTSWWSAWLNSHDDAMVIAPDPWSKTGDCPDLIPPEWTTIPTT